MSRKDLTKEISGIKEVTMIEWMVGRPNELTNSPIIEDIMSADAIAVDTETTGLDYTDYPTGISLAWRIKGVPVEVDPVKIFTGEPKYRTLYIPLHHQQENYYLTREIDQVVEFFSYLEGLRHVMHNAVFDRKMLSRIGVKIPWEDITDTVLSTYCAGGHVENLALDDLSLDIFNVKTVKLAELFARAGFKKGTWNTSLLQTRDIAHYACKDAAVTLALYDFFPPQGDICQLEHDLLPLIADLDEEGFPLNIGEMNSLKASAENYKETAERFIKRQLLRHGVNPRTLKLNGTTFKKILAETVGIPLPVTAKGNYSLDQNEVSVLLRKDVDKNNILKLHKVFSTCNTFISAVNSQLNAVDEDGKLRSSWNQIGAKRTGRFSCKSVNLQQISRTKTLEFADGTKQYLAVKQGFIAEPNHYLLQGDYSQIELVIVLHIAGHHDIIENYHHGTDLHALTAARMDNIDVAEILREHEQHPGNSRRQNAKNVNFTIVFGGGKDNLILKYGMDEDSAVSLLNRWHSAYPGVKPVQRECARKLEVDGRIYTLFGRLQKVYEEDHKNLYTRGLSKVVQGTAADVQKIALRQVRTDVEANNYPMRLLAQLHDNQVWMVHNDMPADESMEVLRNGMVNCINDNGFPQINVDVKIGHTWKELA